MKKVDKLLLKPFLALFLLSLCVVVFVLVMQIFLVYFDELIGKSVGWSTYARLIGYMSMYISPKAFALSILIASIITFGNLSEHAELIALKSAGISLFRILLPLLVFVTILSGVTFYLNSYIVPRANLNFINLLYDLRKKKPDLAIKEGVFYDGIPGYSIRVTKKMPDQKTLQGILIYDHTQDRGNVAVTMAESGQIDTVKNGQYLAIDLFNGYNYVEGEVKKGKARVEATTPTVTPFYRSSFKTQRLLFNLESFKLKRTKKELFANIYRAKDTRQLSAGIVELKHKMATARAAFQKFFSDHFMGLYDESNLNLLADKQIDPSIMQQLNALKGPADSTCDKGNLQVDVSGVSALERLHGKEQRLGILKSAEEQAKVCQAQLKSYLSELKDIKKDLCCHEVEQHKMLAWAVSCLIIFLCSAPLGATIRKGSIGVPVLLATLFVVLYYLVEMTGVRWAKLCFISPWLGAWAANIMLLPFGVFLLNRAQRDAPLSASSSLLGIWERIKKMRTGREKNTI